MSGPITCILVGDPITALLSAAGIRAAEAIAAGYAQAAALRGEHDAARDRQRAVQRDATTAGRKAIESAVDDVEARFERLVSLADALGASAQVRATRPVRPEGTDHATLAAYARGLSMLADELEAILVLAAARAQAAARTDATADFEPALADAMQAASPSARLLARIAPLGPIPEDIAHLARELEATPPGERAALLAMELRRRVQLHAEKSEERLVRQATATIVRQSLQDLGYDVEDVGDTMFVDDGVLHFRRPGWGDYLVRMRFDARGRSLNFNVVRAVDATGDDAQASVLDHLAEDRWCAEFPALLDALRRRGVRLDVTRRLEAGEVPVQRVERDRLPEQFRSASDDDSPAKPAPQARRLK